MAIQTLKVASMTGLWRVRRSKILLWPGRVMSPQMTRLNARGKAGYVVDLDNKYEKVLCWNMEKMLERVPASEEESARARLVDPTEFPRPISVHLAKLGLVKTVPMKRKPTRRAAMTERATKQEAPKGDAPGLDEAPKGRRTRRRKGGDGDAAQDTPSTDSD